MLTPNHVVTTARVVLVGGALAAATLMLGPWPGLEHVFGLTDKAAHAIAFGALLAVSFLAFPRMRRTMASSLLLQHRMCPNPCSRNSLKAVVWSSQSGM